MTRQSKTKLLKMVCKNAQLMRDRFRDASWTSKTSQSDTKPLIINKTGEKFRSKIAKLSVGKTWSSIQKVCIKKNLFEIIILTNYLFSLSEKKQEWVVVNKVPMFKQREQCLCGRANLKYVTYLKNVINNREITSGNCCLLTFNW